MALVDREKMTDATGAVHLYRPVPNNTPGIPPEYPHPDAIHHARTSGRGLHPCFHLRPLAEDLAYYEERGEEPDMPVDGDQTARWRALQCWDDQIGRQPDKKKFTGNEPCENPECPHPKPHCAGQWFSDDWPRFRDIAHVLYPGGRVPWPLGYRGPRIYSGGWDQWQPFKDYAPEPEPETAPVPEPAPEPERTPEAPAQTPVQLDLFDVLEDLS